MRLAAADALGSMAPDSGAREMSIRFFAGALFGLLAWLCPLEPMAAVAIKTMLEPWHGDLDGMIDRRYIRILTIANKTNYFFDKGRQRGATVETAHEFEEIVNKRLGSKTLRVTVALLPVARDELIPALLAGRGDIAAANLTITPERAKLVDFGSPFVRDVKEVLVTPKSTPLVASADAMSGTRIFVRPSSSYYASLQAQNAKLKAAGKKPIEIVDADERLENEDLLEMVNAEIVPAVIVDDAIADFWASVLPNLRVHPDAAVRTGGEIAWAVRKTSPKLKSMV